MNAILDLRVQYAMELVSWAFVKTLTSSAGLVCFLNVSSVAQSGLLTI